jgi:hypothetical protein
MEIISNTSVDISSLNERINNESAFVDLLNIELSKTIVGQKYMIERLLLAMLSNGHILLEGVPGLAKNACHQIVGCRHSWQVCADPVYTGPVACRSDRNDDLQSEGRRIFCEAWTGLR